MPIASSQTHVDVAHDRVGTQPHAVVKLRAQTGGARAWVRALRVHQWTKNLLVVAAPAAAGVLGRSGVFWRVGLTAIVFCLLASGAYLINDVTDAPEDRLHPAKRHRPIASGAVAATTALVVGVALIAVGLAVSSLLGAGLLLIASCYVVLNAAYTALLRRVAVADIVAIAAAFVIRALAGGVAAQVPISRWFIVFVSWSALLVAAGKRLGDYLDPAARSSREVLQTYSAGFLRLVIATSCVVALVTYCMWAFQTRSPGGGPWRELSVIPVVLVTLRYRTVASRGAGATPERILLGDRFVQLAGVAWLAIFALGV